MKSYRELNIYKTARELAIEVHRISLLLPKFEVYEEGSQIRRSSKAVSTAIVEGYGRRRYKAEFIRYLTFSQAECDETMEHLDYLFETKSFSDKVLYDSLKQKYSSLSKQINKFINWVENNWNNFSSEDSKDSQ